MGARRGSANRFHGMIDGVHIYGRVLNGEEIRGAGAGRIDRGHRRKAGGCAQRLGKPRTAMRTSWRMPRRPRFAMPGSADRVSAQEKEKLERTFPTVMVMAESPVRKADAPADPRRLRQARRNGGARDSRRRCRRCPTGAPNNRLGFAKWLVSPENPLLARVTMNRFWQMYFGTGIVKTVEDFGVAGRVAVASRTARLAGHRIRPHRLGHQRRCRS